MFKFDMNTVFMDILCVLNVWPSKLPLIFHLVHWNKLQ